jgi:hypothetical protein
MIKASYDIVKTVYSAGADFEGSWRDFLSTREFSTREFIERLNARWTVVDDHADAGPGARRRSARILYRRHWNHRRGQGLGSSADLVGIRRPHIERGSHQQGQGSRFVE